jgi:DNA repair exonuclease SbcCD ATPase subunit
MREILNDHKIDIERLKSKLTESENTVKTLQEKIQNLQENQQNLLEKTLEISGNWKNDIPQLSTTQKQVQQPIANIKPTMFRMSDLQLLILLKKGKADTVHFAVAPIQLKLAYSLDKSERTIRNKLIELEYQGFVATTGSRPKKYYLNKAGNEVIQQQRRNSISFEL